MHARFLDMGSYQGLLKNYLSLQDKLGTKLCILCHQGNVNELLHGSFQTDVEVSAHFYCLLFASGLCQNGTDEDGIYGFLKHDILMESRRGARLNCSHCRKPGATVGCGFTTCRRSYHFPCGIESKMLNQYFGEFSSYCNKHQPKQVIPSNYMVSKATCMICQEDLNTLPSFDAIWAPCCKKAWFHRTCLQKLASNAGHLFKCPLCSNNNLFCCEMKQYGIFIVEEDASWEMDSVEFQQFVGTETRCSKEKCLCPKGRDYGSQQTRWELVRCRSCGSKGVHIGCGDLSLDNKRWDCDDCKPETRAVKSKVVNKSKPLHRDRNLLEQCAHKEIPARNLSRFESTDTFNDETSSYEGSAHQFGPHPSIPGGNRATQNVTKGKHASIRAVASRNVAKRGRPLHQSPHYNLRFVVHEHPETGETWVWYGRRADDLPPNPHIETIAPNKSRRGICTDIVKENLSKTTIFVWCGKPWDSLKPFGSTTILTDIEGTRQGKRH